MCIVHCMLYYCNMVRQCYFHSEKISISILIPCFLNNFISISNFHFTENSYFNSNSILWLYFLNRNYSQKLLLEMELRIAILQFLIPFQATISTSIHILIPIHLVRSVATQEYMLVRKCNCHSSSGSRLKPGGWGLRGWLPSFSALTLLVGLSDL